jgi:hypothetical protein
MKTKDTEPYYSDDCCVIFDAVQAATGKILTISECQDIIAWIVRAGYWKDKKKEKIKRT